ncbi:MAG TPA: bifunctional UDP-N-acetylglucosamine diphosphorylase/glucosamine-1-phosphate N-acetyltransferase GlmU [Rhizomicrobium sp.]|nr:bifunctional UDP-N-acetylglucosamine diphosphorylase/glucosamine-1-phosphate N-acetyltransferase GlmU [Rhizomicrobium sp.]
MANLAGIILAAGQGTRMKSAKPKVMHTVAGRPILGHVMAAMRAAGIDRLVVITAADARDVRDYAAAEGAESVIQEPQLGTGHAANAAREQLKDFEGTVVTTYGDMPLVTRECFEASLAAREKTELSLAAFRADDPAAYGRVILDSDGLLDRIVEYKDANERERACDLCNAGIFAADARKFFRWTAALRNDNAQGEYYLTDVPTLARRDGIRCAVAVVDEMDVTGVNSRAELARAEREMQSRLRDAALAGGVGMRAPDTVYLSWDTLLEPDVQIEPFVVFGPGVIVRSGAAIRAFSHLEGAEVGRNTIVGPYARLRAGAVLGEDVHIGNFVEIKNSRVENTAKVNHLSYIGDASLGAATNIGAGTITCNYDGFDKHRTEIGAGAFIGSNTALVAPVKVGDGAYIGAGSTIAKDVAPDALAVVRAEQAEKPGWAKDFRARKKAGKAMKGTK